METFSALLAICAVNSPVTGEFPAQRPVTRSFGVFFDLRLKNGWVNNGEAGDFRRHLPHYDVTVMGPAYIVESVSVHEVHNVCLCHNYIEELLIMKYMLSFFI